MSDNIDPNARREVNDAIATAGSNAIGQMVNTANSSIEKRRRNKEIRAKREAEEKAAKEVLLFVPDPNFPICCTWRAMYWCLSINEERKVRIDYHSG